MKRRSTDTPTMELMNPRADIGDGSVEYKNGHYYIVDTPPASNIDKMNDPFKRNYLDVKKIQDSQRRVEEMRSVVSQIRESIKMRVIREVDGLVYQLLELKNKTDNQKRIAEINNISAIALMGLDPEIYELLSLSELKEMRDEIKERIKLLIANPESAGKHDNF